ncbi:uncharacterized protein EV154DRAFT_488273 [Mucor mucedo]|uniref:uncharacterized protein n=1 Tax=Mucor mucedo TaxID=29922 RepID=UPI00221F94FE|nr:uncharacterized protein EV154DRAFT_488273 [Mucor mucedo]KAI7867758.1 hypothetical protein EV154DRAFT_488273 [Mucor mucedo]
MRKRTTIQSIIDIASNEVRVPKSLDSTAAMTPDVASVCSISSSLHPAGLHHTYVDINGPPNTLAFISTATNVAMENSSLTPQHIAFYEYLAKSPTLYPISHSSPNRSSIHSPTYPPVSSTPEPALDLLSSVGDTLSGYAHSPIFEYSNYQIIHGVLDMANVTNDIFEATNNILILTRATKQNMVIASSGLADMIFEKEEIYTVLSSQVRRRLYYTITCVDKFMGTGIFSAVVPL